MSHIPPEVALRLEELSGAAMSIQNANFSVDDLQYHQPRVDVGAARGSWARNGVEFEFRIIGQVSAHHTFLQDYGDMFQHKDRSRYSGSGVATVADVCRAKWKITLALPHGMEDTPHRRILLRQFQTLLDIETCNLESPWAAGQGESSRC